ncbi:MAG: sphingomyelin phosphodiesterase, partial [Polyangiaceae bacterium]|nr:sphingomyelin phosphodiesterase [Polyangiaceae bacterium]
EARARRICAEVLATTPRYHVVCLQEVFDEDVRAIFARELRSAYPHQVARCSDGDVFNDDSGLFFATSLPIRRHRFHEFDAKEPFTGDAFVDKGIFGARLELGPIAPGVSLCVFNTHLQSTEAHDATRARQLAEVRQFVGAELGRCQLESTCAVLAGDLNVVGDSSAEYRSMLRRLDGAHDVFREAHPDAALVPGYTWNGRDNLNMIPASDADTQRLDYVLAFGAIPVAADDDTPPRELRPLSLDAAAVVPFGPGPADRLSDHFGVSATVTPQTGASARAGLADAGCRVC